MDTTPALAALADPTRRAIFELLASAGPSAVGQLADRLPVSRPAVSQHLKVLAEAGLVRVSAQGTRRVHVADPSGLAALHHWLDEHWTAVLDEFDDAAHRRSLEMTTDPTPSPRTTIAPVVKRRTVPLPPAAAFDLFTTRLDTWWPLATHSISGDTASTVTFEGRVGGRIVEHTPDGQQHSWADVLTWDPPHRVAVSWHPSVAPTAASRVEVRFAPHPDGGTELVLEHGGWDEFGDRGVELRDQYEQGWEPVLDDLDRVAAPHPTHVE